MSSILQEFRFRRSAIEPIHWNEARNRLSGLYIWMEVQAEISSIKESIQESIDIETVIDVSEHIIQASTAEEIAYVGFFIMESCTSGHQPNRIANDYHIYPVEGRTTKQSLVAEAFSRYINPALDYIELELEKIEGPSADDLLEAGRSSEKYPLEITQSLKEFLKENPDIKRNAFVMMQFGDTSAHDSIMRCIRAVLGKYGITAFRADEKEYHEDLFPNVLTYIYGCSFGIAVFERLQDENFNPNVASEVGYMRALKKPICLLKDQTLTTLHSDLVGKIFRPFDPQDAEGSIPGVLEDWLKDKDIITG